MSRGVGCKHGSDLAWLWLWRRPVAVALTQPLAWEPPYATGEALKKKKKRKKELGQALVRSFRGLLSAPQGYSPFVELVPFCSWFGGSEKDPGHPQPTRSAGMSDLT